jgi:hypothetical protein
MKAIIRSRAESVCLNKPLQELKRLNIEVQVFYHPLNMSFADFHNWIFQQLTGHEYYLIIDDDVIPNEYVFDMLTFLKENKDFCMVAGVCEPNNPKIRRIYQKCFKDMFNFGCCIIKGNFISKIKIPSYLECSEDDYCRKIANEHGLKYKILNHCLFYHISEDWEKKLLRGIKWHIANARKHYEMNGNKIDELCLFHYTDKMIRDFATKTKTKAMTLDRKIAVKMELAILEGYFNYTKYLVNR